MEQPNKSIPTNKGDYEKKMKEEYNKQQELEEQRRILLKEFLTPEAKERISRLALVKPDKARKIEDLIIQSASSGRITTKLDEPAIIAYIEQLNEFEQKTETKITIKRKVCDSDDDLGIDENL